MGTLKVQLPDHDLGLHVAALGRMLIILHNVLRSHRLPSLGLISEPNPLDHITTRQHDLLGKVQGTGYFNAADVPQFPPGNASSRCSRGFNRAARRRLRSRQRNAARKKCYAACPQCVALTYLGFNPGCCESVK